MTNPGITSIAGTGTPIVSGDDNGQPVTLGGPGFPFFGTIYNALAATTNGYLSTLLSDSGPDLSNDAFLPTVPSTGGGGRFYVLHDDLNVIDSVYHQYFAVSPYLNPGGGTQSANIFEWKNTTHFGGGSSFDFQAVLFDNGNMLFLYGPGNPESGSGSTTGVMDPTYTEGYLFASNTGGSIPDNFALAVLYAFAINNLQQAVASGPHRKEEPTVLLTDVGAIHSLLTTGLSTALAQRSLVQNAPAGALRDLNDRL
ncbi:MAG: hypothetical protein AB7I98_15585, partial [Verrucomicrobiales bacterium]